ncbi:MAG: metallophosphoesterase family protein [Bacteroidota bacterium]
MSKIQDLRQGRIMVVSDLHGNWADYVRVMTRFQTHVAAGEADRLVFLGDLVHARGGREDASLAILDDLIRKRCNAPDSPYHCLLGNHEMVHIYHIELWKGEECYTQDLEDGFGLKRSRYVEFLMNMPFIIRTGGGVGLVHSGASKAVGGKHLSDYEVNYDYIKHWPHAELLEAMYAQKLTTEPEYEGDMLDQYDRNLGWLFTDTKKGRFLWEFLMNKNERAYGAAYYDFLRRYLLFFSKQHPVGLKVLVSGHIHAPYGSHIVADQQLRISTGYGAESNEMKTYLLIEADREYENATQLEACGRWLWA